MKALVQSVRIAPKKANLIAKLVRGMPVLEAISALGRTHKKGARIVEDLLKSAVANASHNDRQDASILMVKTIVVNQGAAYRRGVPMARGRVRPMKKFLSHISVTLGVIQDEAEKKTSAKAEKPAKTTAKKASQTAKNAAQSPRTSASKKTTSADTSSKKEGARSSDASPSA